MDPIDFNNLASSRYNSTENLFNSLPCESTNNSGLSSRWRSSRRSLRSSRRGMYKDCNVKKTTHEIQIVNSISRIFFNFSGSRESLYESVEAESERLLDEREIELRKRLQGFEEGKVK